MQDLEKLSYEELQGKLKELTELVFTFAHDIRNPISAASLGAQLIARKPGNPDYVVLQANHIVDTLRSTDREIQEFLKKF